jgi:hypothetical protein
MIYSLAAHGFYRRIEGVIGTTDEGAHRLEGYKCDIIVKTETDLESDDRENYLRLSVEQK